MKKLEKKIELSKLKQLPYQKPEFKNGILYGNIPILDINYGNVWTNIHRQTAENLNLKKGNKYNVVISNKDKQITINNIVYSNTFGDIKQGKPVLYFNSLDYLAIALNSGNLAKQKGIGYGEKWRIEIKNSH